MKTITKVLITGITAALLTACGSSSSSNTTPTAQDQAIDKISNYAQNGGAAPTLQDYLDAGITGITNVDEINAYVSGLTKEDVDTKEEIQTIAAKLGVSLSPVAKIYVTRASDTTDPAVYFKEGQLIRFSGEQSTDPDGTIVSYQWSEGSKMLASISVFDTSTLSVGKHTITLTVTDNNGNSTSTDVIVRVSEAPAAVVAAPVVAAATFSGIHTNLPIADLTGWTECYKATYDIRGQDSLADIQSGCSGNNIMLACRVTDSDTLQLAASAARDEVFLDTGDGNNVVHTANGVDWYYSESYSMGFAPVGEGVSRSSADVMSTQNGDRLSWHTGGGNMDNGWRCGSDVRLNGSTAFEKIIYQAD